NLETLRAVEGMRRFDRPTLLLWGKRDTNFGPAIAERLAKDIPGFVRIELLENSAHMPMPEEPEAYAREVLRFFVEGRDYKVEDLRLSLAAVGGDSRCSRFPIGNHRRKARPAFNCQC